MKEHRSVFVPLGLAAYTDSEDLTVVSEKHSIHSHIYADDTQLIFAY